MKRMHRQGLFVFPLIKLAKKLKGWANHTGFRGLGFPLIKLAKKLKETVKSNFSRYEKVSIN